MPLQHPTKKIMNIELTIVLLSIMAVINTIKFYKPTNKISFYNIRTEDPYISLLNEYGVRNSEQIKIYGYKTEF